MKSGIPIVVLGAGPAGLGAALCLARRGGFAVTVLERNDVVGGMAGSFELEGLRVDYGSHRLHPACSPAILADIRSLLGEDLMARPRHGRIYLRSRWVHFPLKPLNMAFSLPPGFLLGALRDGVYKARQTESSSSFASVLEAGLGKTICRDFYFPYAKKIWGCEPSDLDAEQARRRVSASSLGKLFRKVIGSIPGFRRPGSGIFYYPRHGYGQISEAYHREAVQAGAEVQLGVAVTEVSARGEEGVKVRAGRNGDTRDFSAALVLSTIPLSRLVHSIRPKAPEAVSISAAALRSRAMLLIYLVLETNQFTCYDAHYFPGLDVSISRLSEPKNYGLSGPSGTTVLCAELPCSADDEVWSASDDQLMRIVLDDLARVGLPVQAPVRRVVVRRLKQAYPIYTRDYRHHFERLDQWASNVPGIVSLGRQGLFAHDNTHHTLAMAYAASDCIDNHGRFDRDAWKSYRSAFADHVVED